MTGQQLIDAIQEHHLENLDVFHADTELCSGILISVDNGDIELPYPEYKDAHFDEPAHIYKYKVLEIDNKGNSECYDQEFDTSKLVN